MHTSQNSNNKPTFSIYPKRKSKNINEATLYCRINYQFSRTDRCLGLQFRFDDWDSKNQIVKDNDYVNKLVTDKFSELKEKIMGAFYLLTQNGASPSLYEIMDLAIGESKSKSYTLFGVFDGLIARMERQIRRPGQKANIIKHRTCYRYLKNFVKGYLNANDVAFSRINKNFIEEFEHFLRNECNNAHNSSMKLLQIFKKVYRIAIDNRWTSSNAFAGKRLSYKDSNIEVLTKDEMKQLVEFLPKKQYLVKTRQLFLFCYYTGLSYVDMQKLQREHIEFNPVSGQFMIRKRREKTGVEFMIPLFKPANDILESWIENWQEVGKETYLCPRLSNQKYNIHLKELFAFLSIQKKITSHTARHTFATTLALENGVPIESVSKMLGHSKLSQTQKYAKVTAMKIEKETRELFEKLNQ